MGLQSNRPKLNWLGFFASAIIYTGFAAYLYYPHFKRFNTLGYLVVCNAVAAALGCFVLSRRWINLFPASLFAGLVYGFGPFALGFGIDHPLAGSLLAAMGWLFCPAAFWPRRESKVRPFIRVVLSLLAPAAIIFIFWFSSKQGFFPIPKQAKLHLADSIGLVTPLVMEADRFAFISFYHVGLGALVMGLFMFFAVHRAPVMVILTAGLVLGFCDSVLGVSPIIWAAVAVLCCSILVGLGMQGLVSATSADKRWVLTCAVIMAMLAITTAVLGMKISEAFLFTAKGPPNAFFRVWGPKMYALSTLAVTIIFFITRAKLRAHWLRWTVLIAAAGIDVFVAAPIIVDKIF